MVLQLFHLISCLFCATLHCGASSAGSCAYLVLSFKCWAMQLFYCEINFFVIRTEVYIHFYLVLEVEQVCLNSLFIVLSIFVGR